MPTLMNFENTPFSFAIQAQNAIIGEQTAKTVHPMANGFPYTPCVKKNQPRRLMVLWQRLWGLTVLSVAEAAEANQSMIIGVYYLSELALP